MVPEIGHELILASEGMPYEQQSYRRGLPWQTPAMASNSNQISQTNDFAVHVPNRALTRNVF
jgi:hypothetical protein